MDDKTTAEYIAEIEARCEAATRGPWKDDVGAIDQGHVDGLDTWTDLETIVSAEFESDQGYTYGTPIVCKDEDRQFIAHARQDIPFLIGALRAAMQCLEDVIKVDKDPAKAEGGQG